MISNIWRSFFSPQKRKKQKLVKFNTRKKSKIPKKNPQFFGQKK
jgi:hypothetical protein